MFEILYWEGTADLLENWRVSLVFPSGAVSSCRPSIWTTPLDVVTFSSSGLHKYSPFQSQVVERCPQIEIHRQLPWLRWTVSCTCWGPNSKLNPSIYGSRSYNLAQLKMLKRKKGLLNKIGNCANYKLFLTILLNVLHFNVKAEKGIILMFVNSFKKL